MEGDSRTHYYNQDNLAVEVLNKLHSSSGFTTVAVPEGFSLHPSAANSSLLQGATSLNASLITPSASQGAVAGVSSDGVLLGSAASLDSALTQFLVAAQSGGVNQNSAASLVSNLPSALAPSVAATVPSSSAQLLHPVLSASLTPVPSQTAGTDVLVANIAAAPPEPTPVAGSEPMTITVHCTTSDTVIVVGQHNWQCCMCRDMHGFDTSIDQHLAVKHSLVLTPSTTAPQEERVVSKDTSATAGFEQPERVAFGNSSVPPSSAEPLQTISEQALASLQNPDSANARSGLEREVALLMAQTFTHSGTISLESEEAKKESDFTISTEGEEKFKHEPDYTESVHTSASEQAPPSKDGEVGSVTVYNNMINKVERAILSTVDSEAKNDLLLVATELARMQKDLTSKRRQMKKYHRYITCPECGKEVRNRKDLIKQHNRCHEKTKKYRCLVCNKMFKYTHTLRRHVLQQGHKGGMPEDLEVSPPQDLEGSVVSVGEVSFEKLVKAEVDEGDSDSGAFVTVDLSSLSVDESKTVPPDKKAGSAVPPGEPAYEKILAMLLSRGEQNRTPQGRKVSLLQCFVCDREIRNRNYYITRHARCHMEDLCYTCSVCGVEFYRTDYYKEHMAQHGQTSSENNTELDVSSSKEKLSQVEEKTDKSPRVKPKRVTTSKPATVPCKICGKGIFNRTYNIKRHAQQHSILEWESILGSSQDSPSTRKPPSRSTASAQLSVSCGLCGQSFKSYTLKRRHMLKHRSSFPCRGCHQRFASGAELLAHSQVCRKEGGENQGRLRLRGLGWQKQVPGQVW